MTRLAIHLRLIVALAVLLAMASLLTAPVAAQDADATPEAAESQPVPVVEEAAPTDPAPAAEEPVPAETPLPPVETPVDPAPAEAPVDPVPTEEAAEPVVTEPSPGPVQEPAPESSPVVAPASAAPSNSSRAAVDTVSPAEDPVTTVDIVVAAFDCADTPVGNTPGVVPAGCTAAVGVSFTATADDAPLGPFITTGTGTVVIPAPDGAELVVVEDQLTATTGFTLVGTGTESLTVTGPGGLSFVHVADDGPVVENAGRLQLSQGSCPTLGEERTELRYIAPQSLRAQAEGSGCGPVGGSEFVIEGGDFPAGGATKTTQADGNWRGEISAGSYTVTHVGSGQSIAIEIVEDDITVIVAIDYVPQVAGTLSVRRYKCGGDEDGTTISVASAEPAPSEGCSPEDGTFQLSEGDPFNGGGDGAITFQVPIGTYQFSDLTIGDGTSTEIQIAAGATTWVLVEHIVSGGDISILYNFCRDVSGDPGDAAYWASACNNPLAGANLKLIGAAGTVVAEATTDDAGYATFTNVADGTYRLRGGGDRTTCAVFVGDQAALGGFQIAAGQILQSQVFGCTKAAGNPGGETPGGETPGNGAPGTGSGGGIMPPAQAPSSAPSLVPGQTVTQLPSTGVAGPTASGTPFTVIVLTLVAMVMALGGGVAFGFKRQR